MALVRTNNGLNSLFADFFNSTDYPVYRRRLQSFSPTVDLYEEEGVLKVEADLPGVDRNEVKVELENGVLTISGERNATERKEGRSFSIERSFGSFSRSFRIGNRYDVSEVKASYDAGILTVSIPRKEEVKPVQIEIH